MRLFIAITLLMLAGCASTSLTRVYEGPDGRPITETVSGSAASYSIYTEASVRVAEAQSRSAASAPVAACAPGDSVCAVAVAGFGAIAAIQARQPVNLAPPPRERDFGEKARDFLTGAAAIAVPAFGAYTNLRSQEYARDEREYFYDFLGRNAEAYAEAGPRITVGGNYGDTFGDNYTGRDRAETNIGDDFTGRDRTETNIDIGIGGDNIGRDDNENSFNGAPCTVTLGNGQTTTGALSPSGTCVAGSGGG
jgi:hypothetical protein